MRCQSTTKYRGEILQCEDEEGHVACHYHLNVLWGNPPPKKKRLSGAQRRKRADRNAKLKWNLEFGFNYP